MISRRDFLQVSMAASALVGASGAGNWARLAAQQRLTQDRLLEFDSFGNVTLIHITDIHAQLKPVWFREPSVNLGVGESRGRVPHVTGADFRRLYGIEDGSPSAYALTHDDFSALAREYGRVGGLDLDDDRGDRLARVGEHPARVGEARRVLGGIGAPLEALERRRLVGKAAAQGGIVAGEPHAHQDQPGGSQQRRA